MKIETRAHKGIKVFAISGDIDMYSSPELRKELLVIIKKKEKTLVVDFVDVTYIDSSGIATFVEGLKGMMSYGGKLKLMGIPDKIIEIFTFSKLDKVFDIYGDIESAVNS